MKATARERVALPSSTSLWREFCSRVETRSAGESSFQRETWLTVVGVVADFRQRALDDIVSAELFRPYTQAPSPWMTLVIRSATPPSGLAPGIRKALQTIDRNQPLFGIESLEERLSNSLAERRERALLLGIFAFVALVIAAIGVYAVMAYSVTRRTHEIGLRIALGAQRRDVLKMVILDPRKRGTPNGSRRIRPGTGPDLGCP